MNTAENPEQLLVNIAAILNKLKIRYFVTGGFAISVWGRPRATFDIDIVIQLAEPQVDDLAKALRALYKHGYIDEDMAKQAIKSKREFNFIDSNSGLKIDFIIGPDDKFTRQKFQRRKLKTINGQKVSFISPEDLILSKLLWHQESLSDRQLEDAKSIIKISGKRLDRKYLNSWAEKLKIDAVLEKLEKEM